MKPIIFACRETLSLDPVDIAEHILDVTKWRKFRGYWPIPGIKSAVFDVKTQHVVGSRIRMTNSDGSTHVEEIMEWEPDRRLRLRMGNFSQPLSRLATEFLETWEFVQAANATTVIRSFELHARSLWTKPLLWLISFFLRSAVARHLRDFKGNS